MNATNNNAVPEFEARILPEDGRTTCLLHRHHQWIMANHVQHMPRCRLCGGVCSTGTEAHELCLARAKRNMPTPQLDGAPKCGCAKCAKMKMS